MNVAGGGSGGSPRHGLDEGWRFDEVAAVLEERDLELATLTDEELAAVLGELVEDGFYVDLPVYDALDAPGRQLAGRAAARSLRARGLLAGDPESEATTAQPTAGVVVGDLATILHVLAEPSSVVIADVERAGRSPAQRAWLAVDEVAVLDHQPDAAGLHRFVLRSPRRAAAALVDAVDPEGMAANDGASVEHVDGGDPEEGWVEVERVVEHASVLSRVFATRPGEGGPVEHEVVVAATGEGVWLLGAMVLGDGRVGRRATPVSRASLAGVALALLGQVPDGTTDR